MRGLKGKNVLVTGGASGIGQATAQRFLEEGCSVCVFDRDAEARTRVSRELPGLTAVIDADVTKLDEEWDDTIDSSLKGAFLMSKYELPSMIERGSGSIIHTSSGWGIQGGDKAAAYCAAKGRLIVMAKAMALDHGRHGIRVNCVCPGEALVVDGGGVAG